MGTGLGKGTNQRSDKLLKAFQRHVCECVNVCVCVCCVCVLCVCVCVVCAYVRACARTCRAGESMGVWGWRLSHY